MEGNRKPVRPRPAAVFSKGKSKVTRKPDYQREGITLYRGDCLEILPEMEAGSVDAVVTDPPYGIGFKYESHDDSPEGYGEFIWKAIEYAEAKLNPGSPCFVWQVQSNTRNFSEWFPRDWRVFISAKNFTQIRNIPMFHGYDPVLVWWTEGEYYRHGSGSRDWFVSNTAAIVSQKGNIEKGHPCPRPCDVCTHIIQEWCRENGCVLDPFLGSGTTAIACIRTGRKCIGIELEQKYFDIAVKRIDKELDHPRLCLFDKPEPVVARPKLNFDEEFWEDEWYDDEESEK